MIKKLNGEQQRVLTEIGYCIDLQGATLEKIIILGIPKEKKKDYINFFVENEFLTEKDVNGEVRYFMSNTGKGHFRSGNLAEQKRRVSGGSVISNY